MQRGWNLLELPWRISLLPKKSLSRALCPYNREVRGKISLWGFLSIILKRQQKQLQPKASAICVQLSFIRFCFSAAASALYQTSFAGSCLTPWCTNTWASAQTDQCPRISSRFRQPLFSLILSTHSGSSLETKMENFTWEWVLAAIGPWAGHENLWCHQGVTLVPICQTHQVSL